MTSERLRLTIPEEQQQGVATLAKLSDAEVTALVGASRATEPCLAIGLLEARLSERSGVARSAVAALLPPLISLALTVEEAPSVEDLASAVAHAAFAEGLIASEEAQRLRGALIQLLDPAGPLVISAKAIDLRFEVRNVLVDSRIVSDVRPIFAKQGSDGLAPRAAMILHNLELTTIVERKERRFFVSVDRPVLEQLSEKIRRALEKDTQLRTVIQGAGLTHMEANDG